MKKKETPALSKFRDKDAQWLIALAKKSEQGHHIRPSPTVLQRIADRLEADHRGHNDG